MADHTAYTPRLSGDWDFIVNKNGDLEMLRQTEAIVQNVACECRMSYHDAYFRWEDGVKHLETTLGQGVQIALTQNELRKATLRVSGVKAVESIVLHPLSPDRTLTGTISLITTDGENVRAII